jgi:hypothetical protein
MKGNERMGRKNYNAYIKRQKAEIKKKKKMEKRLKKEARKHESTSNNLKNMIAYVDENGNITSEPPEKEDSNHSEEEI